MRTWLVEGGIPTGTLEVQANWLEISGDNLVFYDLEGVVIRVFSKGTWTHVKMEDKD